MRRLLIAIFLGAFIWGCFLPAAYADSIGQVQVSLNKTAKVFSLTGMISPAGEKMITIRINDPTGSLEYINQVNSQADGRFEITYIVQNVIEGNYKIEIGAEALPENFVTTFNAMQDAVVTGKRQSNSSGTRDVGSLTADKKPPEASSSIFTDITNHWAKEEIAFMFSKNIVKGVSINLFAPDKEISRAEFVTLLVRSAALSDKRQATQKFTDVLPGSWYYDAVNHAASANIIEGMGNGKFAPEQCITRQQMALIISRILIQSGICQTIKNEQSEMILQKFPDNGQVSTWARVGVATANHAGIVKGRSNGIFDPEANATRAEGIVMIKHMMSVMDLLE